MKHPNIISSGVRGVVKSCGRARPHISVNNDMTVPCLNLKMISHMR